jgi:hypothetical protein
MSRIAAPAGLGARLRFFGVVDGGSLSWPFDDGPRLAKAWGAMPLRRRRFIVQIIAPQQLPKGKSEQAMRDQEGNPVDQGNILSTPALTDFG